MCVEESELVLKLSSNSFGFDHTMKESEKNSFGYNYCVDFKKDVFLIALASNQSSSLLVVVMALHLSSLAFSDTMSMVKNNIFE